MILWCIIIAALVILDQVTKILVAGNMVLYESIPVIPKLFSLTYIHNYGAAWGMFSEHRWVFLIITAIALIIMPIILYRYRKLHFLFGFSLSMILAGAIGNMIDRVFLGYVVDFIEVVFIDFPIFNVADICVVVGAVLMAIYLIFLDKTFFVDKPKNKPAGETEHGTEPKDDTH